MVGLGFGLRVLAVVSHDFASARVRVCPKDCLILLQT